MPQARRQLADLLQVEAKYSDLDGSEARWLKALAQERRRFGYRRLHVLLRREGHAVNKKRVQRLYREERLMVRQRGGRKRAMGTRRPIETPAVANQRWSLDFIADQFTDGRRFRILEVWSSHRWTPLIRSVEQERRLDDQNEAGVRSRIQTRGRCAA